MASSSALTDFSRPTNSGTGWCGKTTMSRKGRIGRILISDMMLQLLSGRFGLPARAPGRGHSDDASESDDPSAGLRRACYGFMWTVLWPVQAEQDPCATLRLSTVHRLA